MRFLRSVILATTLLLVAGASAHAKTWIGGTAGAANSWNSATNWSPSGIPGTTDAVLIDGAVSNVILNIDANVDVASFTVQNNYTRDIAPTGGQTIHVAGNMVLTSSSTGFSLRVSTGSTQIDGDVTFSLGSLLGNGGTLRVLGNMTQSGGTFTTGTGTTQIDGSFTEAGGTLTGGTGTIQVGANVAVSSGTFNGGAGLIQIGGNLGPLSGGTFRASSTTTRVGGAFNRTSAGNTFNANAGTLLFNASSSQTHTFNGAALAKIVVNDGLAGYWRLDEISGTVLADVSGYGNDGSLAGGASYTTSLPSAIAYTNASGVTFDGSSGVATLGTTNLPATDGAQSISAWVNFSGASATQTIVGLTATGAAIKLGLGSGNLNVRRNDGTVLAQVAAPSTGAWHHVAYVYDPTLSGASRDKLYVDGVASTGTNNGHDSASPTGAFAGAASAAAELFAGSLDDIRIYRRALGVRELRDLAFGRMPATGVATHTFADALVTSSGSNVGHMVILSGVLAGSSTLSVEGDWLNYGGRFTGTGTVTLNGGGTRVLLSGGESFPSLIVNATGKYTLQDRLWVTGALNLAGQSASFGDGGYVVHAGTFTTTSTSAYQVAAGAGALVLDGRSNQSLGQQQSFNSLRIEAPNEPGLVAYWKLDEGQGTATRDLSGSGNSGTLSATGAAWGAASTTIGYDNPTAMSFDGAAGVVSAGASSLPSAGAAQTISVWVKPSSAAATQTLVAMTAAGSAVKLGLGGGNIQVRRNDGTVLAQTTAPSTGVWHHVAYVFDATASGASRDKLYVDGTITTGTGATHDGASPTAAFLGATSASADFFAGQLDDVRIYSAALTAAQVGSLTLGRYAGTGIATTVTLAHNLAVAATGVGVFIDSGVLYTANYTLTCSVTGTPGVVNAGTLHIGSAVVNFDGGLTVNPMGTLLMDQASGQLQPGVNSTVTIDGTLTASSTGAIIQRDNGGERYAFKVGTFSGSTPTLNISGLAIRDTDANGLWINAAAGAMTTFTRFDSVVFTRGSTGTGTEFVQIAADALYLTASGCTFGAGENTNATPAVAVKLTGNGTGDGETRAVFGGTTCANKWTVGASDRSCLTVTPPSGPGLTAKTDGDANGDGVADSPVTNGGAVVQFVRTSVTDTAGTIEGFPQAAFDWNTYAYYSTYAAFHDASGTADRVYVRTLMVNYSWDTASGETIVGTPKYATEGTSHYLYVAVNGATADSGRIYRLKDDGASLTADTAGNWSGRNPFTGCSCTITTPLGIDTTNLYWGGTTGGAQRAWRLAQALAASTPFGLSSVSITPTITSAAPAQVTVGGTAYLLLGLTGHVLKVDMTNMVLSEDNTSPGTNSVYGRIGLAFPRVFAGDDGGTMWALDFNTFTGTNKVWSYTVAGNDPIKSSSFYDYTNAVLMFGTEGGKVVALNSSGSALTGYPYTPGTTSDSIRSALLYVGGVLAVGTTTGKLFFIDRSAATILREYYFGPTQAVSGIGYDSTVSRYMVTTSDATAKDGRLYYIDLIADQTAGSP